MCVVVFVLFFFKQKTAYEMRISDWSSDVCSSDLYFVIEGREDGRPDGLAGLERAVGLGRIRQREHLLGFADDAPGQHVAEQLAGHVQHVGARDRKSVV